MINELCRLRDAFTRESSRYQEMINKKIMEKFDALKYEGKYIKYFLGGEGCTISYIKCKKLKDLITALKLWVYVVLFILMDKLK